MQLIENDSQMQQVFRPATEQSLTSLDPGAVADVSTVESHDDPNVLRVCELGLIPGVWVELVIKGSNTGYPYLLRFNHFDLCLDSRLASCFRVAL